MRAALLGVYLGNDRTKLKAFVRASARLTHTDPRAEYGAFAVALAAHSAATGSTDSGAYLADLRTALPDNPDSQELLRLLTLAAASAARGESSGEFSADTYGNADRVTGYIYQTIPAALHAWMRYPRDYREAVLGVIACGGDTDTLAAITGAIVGAGVGEQGIPAHWVDGIIEWPHSVRWMRKLGQRLALHTDDSVADRVPGVSVPALMLRNAVFLLVVLLTLLRWYGMDLYFLIRSLLKGSFREDYSLKQ
jgi:ADP-ribosylglycohydrolase